MLPVVAALGVVGCGGDDTRPATFSYIHATILRPSCTTSACHSELSATAGLQLDTRAGAYLGLTGRVCGSDAPGQPPRNLVNPGQPESSRLMYLLLGTEARRMPPDVPLPEADIDLVEQWILEGAECD